MPTLCNALVACSRLCCLPWFSGKISEGYQQMKLFFIHSEKGYYSGVYITVFPIAEAVMENLTRHEADLHPYRKGIPAESN